MRSRVQMLRSRVHRMALWGPRLASKISAEPVPWPPELRSHPGRKRSIFYCVFPRLSSRPTVSPRRDDSRCHQVPIFIDQSRRNAGGHPLQGPFFPRTARTLHTLKLLFGEKPWIYSSSQSNVSLKRSIGKFSLSLAATGTSTHDSCPAE